MPELTNRISYIESKITKLLKEISVLQQIKVELQKRNINWEYRTITYGVPLVVDLNKEFSFVTSSASGGADTVTVIDGDPGMIKTITAKTLSLGDSLDVIPNNTTGTWTTINLSKEGETCTLIWDGSGWNIKAVNGGVIS